MRAALAAMALLAAAGSVQAAPVSGTAPILAAESRRIQAEIAKNLPALRAELADDMIYGHASGVIETKAEYLKSIVAGNWRVRGVDLSEQSVQHYGDVAVTHGIAAYTVEGLDGPRKARYIGVYHRRAGRWQMVAWQNTALRAP